MPIFLERWPPLISHFSCIIIGMIFAYFLSPERTGDECYLPDKILLSLPNKIWVAKPTSLPSAGTKVYFAKGSSESTPCLLKNIGAVIIQAEPYIVASFPLKSAKLVSEILQPKNHGLLSLVTAAKAAGYRSCVETQIKYGYVH